MLSVRDLIGTPQLATRSLTPGVGESRAVRWAHVCELSEPWEWIGGGALVMTTGLALPSDAAAQCAYITGMAKGGIAGLAIGERMSAPPLTPELLACATALDFPILETAHDTPFVTLAMAVAEAQNKERHERVQLTERLYRSLQSHVTTADVEHLLIELGEILDGSLRIDFGASDATRDRVTLHPDQTLTLPLVGPRRGALRYVPRIPGALDYSVFQHAAAIVSGVLAMHMVGSQQRQLHGSILLGNLLDDAISDRTARELVSGHGIQAPFTLALWSKRVEPGDLEKVGYRFEAARIPVLLTEKEGFLVLLGSSTPELIEILEAVAPLDGQIAVGDPFEELEHLRETCKQTRLLLSVSSGSRGRVVRMSDRALATPFLPNNSGSRQVHVEEILGGLFAYDAEHRTQLVSTLFAFLAENRSWVRAAERLGLHRQTLISRIARVEELTGHHLSNMNDTAILWFALQCAVEEGLLDPLS
ncbi:PucR family transcriptional regulator [Leucobacter luti]|uniref:PucR family transcriptional regulator n=1 Tax=Leucobacter luti TaxID=340320 RepID=UPI001C68ABBD|nr:PucR family transcriptional regulator [Leucobacter luti]QYM77075.1 PucR family transcriptional regulator [Leucobacter luti]